MTNSLRQSFRFITTRQIVEVYCVLCAWMSVIRVLHIKFAQGLAPAIQCLSLCSNSFKICRRQRRTCRQTIRNLDTTRVNVNRELNNNGVRVTVTIVILPCWLLLEILWITVILIHLIDPENVLGSFPQHAACQTDSIARPHMTGYAVYMNTGPFNWRLTFYLDCNAKNSTARNVLSPLNAVWTEV